MARARQRSSGWWSARKLPTIHIVLGWTRPEHPWACSRNSCDTRTYQPQWTSTATPRPWPSARPIGPLCNASCKGLPIKRFPFNKQGELYISSPYWTVLDSCCECPIARNLMSSLVAGVDLNHRPLGYEYRKIFLSC